MQALLYFDGATLGQQQGTVRRRVGRKMSIAMKPSAEALSRHADGDYDGQRCICAADCPMVCDGECGCEACTRAWIDAGLDTLIGSTWRNGGAQGLANPRGVHEQQ